MGFMSKGDARSLCQRVREAVENVLGAEYRVEDKGGTMTVEGGLVLRIRVTPATIGGVPSDKVAFAASCRLVGLRADDHGRIVTWGDRQYRIVEVNLRARRTPIIAVGVESGKKYRLPKDVVMKLDRARCANCGADIVAGDKPTADGKWACGCRPSERAVAQASNAMAGGGL